MSAYVPLLTLSDKEVTTTIVVDSIAMWRFYPQKGTTSVYLKTTPSCEVVLQGDFSKELTALYYPPTA